MPSSPKTRKLKARVIRAGFDKSYSIDGSVRVRCSQCEPSVINGVACHERGCPNERK